MKNFRPYGFGVRNYNVGCVVGANHESSSAKWYLSGRRVEGLTYILPSSKHVCQLELDQLTYMGLGYQNKNQKRT